MKFVIKIYIQHPPPRRRVQKGGWVGKKFDVYYQTNEILMTKTQKLRETKDANPNLCPPLAAINNY